MVVIGIAAIGSLFFRHDRFSQLEVKSCFNDVQGLRQGAPVRIAGVDVGTVRRVRANPPRKDCPAEVEMTLTTAYEISIPKDSIAGIDTAGVLGESFVSIDISQATGAPVENYGYLKTKPTTTLEDEIRAFQMFLKAAAAAQTVDSEVQKEKDAPPASVPRKKKP